jgi:TRAP-type C4-dicarboxylate transport system substrate-binding protein
MMWRAAMCRRRLARTVERMKIPSAALVAALLLAGCSLGEGDGGSDKAGGSGAPVVLRLAYPYKPAEGQPDEPALRWFARRVEELSNGDMRVKVSFNVAGEQTPNMEARVARRVRSGDFDLGWLAARVYDKFGVKSFQALQAPFLITDYELLHRVTQSPLADQMLAGLDPLNLSGLAVVPELLRHPAARRHALLSLADYDGARIRDIPSAVTDALVSSLGARPVHVNNAIVGTEISRGHIDGAETPTSRAFPGWTVTANVTFFGKANTIVANTKAFDALTGDQREVLRRAAEETVRHVVEEQPSEAAFARQFCAGGRVVVASRAQVEELKRAPRPVYEQLERDAETRGLIAKIRAMKRSAGGAAPDVGACGRAQLRQTGTETSESPDSFDGTYRWRLTAEGARRSGNPDDPDIGNVTTMTLRGGKWMLGGEEFDSGTFEVRGNHLVFDWPGTGTVVTVSYRRLKGGSLDIKPVLPMDRGDQFVWASEPWRRVGPPVRKIP